MSDSNQDQVKKEKEKHKQKEEERDEQKRKEEKREKKEKRAPYKLPVWQRLLNIVLGAVFIGLSFLALANAETALATALLILGTILLLSGLSRLIDAFYDKEIGGTKRIIRFAISVIILGIGLVVIFFQTIGDNILFGLLGIGLLIQGIGRIFTATFHGAYPAWVKLSKIGLGVASTGIGIAAILPSLLDINLNVSLLLLIVIGFFISGLSRVISGLIGLSSKEQE